MEICIFHISVKAQTAPDTVGPCLAGVVIGKGYFGDTVNPAVAVEE